MITTMYELNNSEYIKKFNYFQLRDLIYNTLIYVLLNTEPEKLKGRNVFIEDKFYNDIYNNSIRSNNISYLHDILQHKETMEIYLSILPMIELYINKTLDQSASSTYDTLAVGINITTTRTTQVIFKYVRHECQSGIS